jgi:hypothetical protein
MLVQTYECEQTAEETPEMCEEAARIIESLELEGQRKLLVPSDGEEKGRIPYREMTAEEQWVYSTVCPHACKVQDYSQSPIPVRVLQVAAHADSLGVFDKILVWAAEPQQDPDPVLLGQIGDGYTGTRWYLFARWGEELDEWPAMLKKAAERFRKKLKATLAEIKVKVEQEIAALDSYDASMLRKKGLPSYYR